MDSCEVLAVCAVGSFLRIGIPALFIMGLGWLIGRSYRKRNGKPKPGADVPLPALAKVLARCRAGEHELTWIRDLDNIPGRVEWCRNCGTMVSFLEVAEPSQKLESKPRIFAEEEET